MENYLVLIADIEKSKKLGGERRQKLQQNLSDTLERLNEGNTNLVSPYTITLGDEFQAVFDKADGLCVDILKVLTALHPVSVRFSLGVGSIDTPINREQALGMDGPAFHLARGGMDELKESGFLFKLNVEGEDTPAMALMNNSLQLLSQRIREWNKNRLQILYMLKEGYDYKEIPEAVDISRPAFYKNKKAGQLEVVDELSKNMALIINQKLEP